MLLISLIKPLGSYMTEVYQGKRTFMSPIILPFEKYIYRLCGVKMDQEMNWKSYTISLLSSNCAGILILFAILLLQDILPLNPQKYPAFSWHLALNAAISFATNTNWQNYSGETAASYFTQMFGFAVQNFVSAATGMSVAIALIRGVEAVEKGKKIDKIGAV